MALKFIDLFAGGLSANRTCSSLPNRSQKWRKQFAAALEIDMPMYSKIERGERRAKRKQVIALAKIFKVNPNDFLSLWLADRIIEVVEDKKEIAGKVLIVAQENLKK